MDPERMMKAVTLMMVVLAAVNTIATLRWMMTMAVGEAGGVPADLALVFNFLDAILMGYVAYHFLRHRDDFFWLGLSADGMLIRKLLIAGVVVGLFASVFEKAATL